MKRVEPNCMAGREEVMDCSIPHSAYVEISYKVKDRATGKHEEFVFRARLDSDIFDPGMTVSDANSHVSKKADMVLSNLRECRKRRLKREEDNKK